MLNRQASRCITLSPAVVTASRPARTRDPPQAFFVGGPDCARRARRIAASERDHRADLSHLSTELRLLTQSPNPSSRTISTEVSHECFAPKSPSVFSAQWPSLAMCMALLLGLCFAASCLAQEDGEAAEAGDRLQNALKLLQQNQANAASEEGADRTSPQEKAAQAAQRQHNDGTRTVAASDNEQDVGEQHAQAEDEYRKAMSNLESVLQQPQSSALPAAQPMLEQQLRELEAKRNALAQQMAQMQAAELATRRQQQQNTLTAQRRQLQGVLLAAQQGDRRRPGAQRSPRWRSHAVGRRRAHQLSARVC